MSRALIETANLVVNLTPRPIEPSWIIEGNPVAQCCVLSKSADGLASTMVWQCSEGKFDWYYDFDETILILEGSIVLENDTMNPTRYSAGDVIFFKDGTSANLRFVAPPSRCCSASRCGCSTSSGESCCRPRSARPRAWWAPARRQA